MHAGIAPGTPLAPSPPALQSRLVQRPAHPARAWMATELTAKTALGAPVRVTFSRDDIRIQGPNVDLQATPQYLQKDCLLFHYPETEALARKVCEASRCKVELGEIKWACAPAHPTPPPPAALRGAEKISRCGS